MQTLVSMSRLKVQHCVQTSCVCKPLWLLALGPDPKWVLLWPSGHGAALASAHCLLHASSYVADTSRIKLQISSYRNCFTFTHACLLLLNTLFRKYPSLQAMKSLKNSIAVTQRNLGTTSFWSPKNWEWIDLWKDPAKFRCGSGWLWVMWSLNLKMRGTSSCLGKTGHAAIAGVKAQPRRWLL